jgi:hypothetical protein
MPETSMALRHPVQNLAWGLTQAVGQDLAGIESPLANQLLRSVAGPIKVRPRVEDCAVVMFTQAWRYSDLGFERSHASSIEAETVVITGPCGDACVYVSMQLLYHVDHPNRRFFLDVAAQCLRAKTLCNQYEGRDTEDEEAFDYEVAGALARASSAIRMMHGSQDAQRIARMLRECAERVERTSPCATSTQGGSEEEP